MKVTCRHCLPEEGVELPEFNQSDKNQILNLAVRSPLNVVKYSVDNFRLSLTQAKFIMAHINTTYGKCNRCTTDMLSGEYVNCPQCGALNFNWKKA